jgi:hypothetical protein
MRGPVAYGQALSEARASDVAAGYCAAIGVAVDGPAIAKYHETSGGYYGPTWVVTFVGTPGVETEVADDRACVVGFSDDRVVRALGERASGDACDEAQAVSYATAAVRATGLLAELVFDCSRELHHGPQAAVHNWVVSWHRTWKDIPYKRDSANAILQAETGALIVVGVGFLSPAADTGSVVVSAEDAARTALAQIGGPVPVGAYPAALVTQVVRPNTFHMPGGSMKPLPGPSRVAWVGQFQAGDQTYEVYVDAETGKVIGGDRWGPRGGAASDFPALAKWFQDVKEFRLYRRRKDGSWPPTPLAVISEKSNSAAYEALKPGGPPAGLPKRFGEYKLTIMRGDESPLDLSYEEKSGVLGLGPKWMKAPKQLTALLAKLGGAAK